MKVAVDVVIQRYGEARVIRLARPDEIRRRKIVVRVVIENDIYEYADVCLLAFRNQKREIGF
ncbi:MAG: hypothetical protein QM775_04280 [Pirellulales bacterium]